MSAIVLVFLTLCACTVQMPAEVAARAGARVVHERRRGYGAAYLRGFQEARGAFIVMGDADDSYDFLDLKPFLDRLRAGDDLVMGNRFKGGIKPGAMPWLHRYVGNPVLSGFLKLLYRTPVRDAHCGMRALRRDLLQRLDLRSDEGRVELEEHLAVLDIGRQLRDGGGADRRIGVLPSGLWLESIEERHARLAN